MRLKYRLAVATIAAIGAPRQNDGFAYASDAGTRVSIDKGVPRAVSSAARQRHLQSVKDKVLEHIEKSPFDMITTLVLFGVAMALVFFPIAYCCCCRKWFAQRRAIRVHGRTEHHFRTVVQAQRMRHAEILKMFDSLQDDDPKNVERVRNAFTQYEASWHVFDTKTADHENVISRYKHLQKVRFSPTKCCCCLFCCCRKNLRMTYEQIKDVNISRVHAENALELALEKRRVFCGLISSDSTQTNKDDVVPGFVDRQEAYFVEPLNCMTHPHFTKLCILPNGALGCGTSPSRVDAVICDFISTGTAMDGKLVSRKQAKLTEHNATLYFWLGVSALPVEVKQYFAQFPTVEKVSTKAKLHTYEPGKVVIHASLPELDKNASTSVHMIAQTFVAIIEEYCRGKHSKLIAAESSLRFTTFDDERFVRNDELFGHMPLITLSALALALTRLPFEQLENLGSQIDLCVLSSRDVPLYEKALDKKLLQLQPLEVTDVDQKQVADKHGKFWWITKHTTKEDRLARLSAFFDTQKAIWNGGYIVGTRQMRFQGLRAMIENTLFLVSDDALAVQQRQGNSHRIPCNTKYTFYSGSIAKGLTAMEISARRAEEGNRVVSVNAASAYHCGGGVLTGGRHALEEAWCMTSTLLRSLLRATYLGHQLGLSQTVTTTQAKGGRRGKTKYIKKDFELHIPVDGCVLSPQVEVFRQQYMDGYKFMNRPVELAGVVSVAAFNKNPRVTDSPLDAPKDEKEYLEQTTKKWRSTVVGAAVMGGKVLVIPDVGCGVFLNDPSDVGSCLNNVLRECEGYFDEVIVLGKPEFCTNALRGYEAQLLDYAADIKGQRSGNPIYEPKAGATSPTSEPGPYADRRKCDPEAPMKPPNSPLQGIIKNSSLMRSLASDTIRPDQVFRELDHARNAIAGRQYAAETMKENDGEDPTTQSSPRRSVRAAADDNSGSSSGDSEVWRDFSRAACSPKPRKGNVFAWPGVPSETSRKKHPRNREHDGVSNAKSSSRLRKRPVSKRSPAAKSSPVKKAVMFDQVVAEVDITLDTER